MKTLSKDAFNLSQDIYNIGGDLEMLNDSYSNFKITPDVYANNLYIISCKTSYLKGVIDVMMQQGYKFSNYEKELMLLNSIIESIDNNFKISNMSELNEEEFIDDFLNFTNKYRHILSIEDEDEDENELTV